MSTGFVYIMFNPSLRSGQYKIGKTTRSPADRARELSVATGVPEPYEVLYEEHVLDCHVAESIVHASLKSSRTPSGKEFFAVDLKKAVSAVTKAADEVGRILSDENSSMQMSSTHIKRQIGSDDEATESEIDVVIPIRSKRDKKDPSQEQREYLRFWTTFLDRISEQTSRFQKVRPGPYYHRTMISVRPKIDYYFTVNKKSIRVELFIATPDPEYNRNVFEELATHKIEIESKFEDSLLWQAHPKDCGIKYFFGTGDYRNDADWNALCNDALAVLLRLESSISPHLQRVL